MKELLEQAIQQVQKTQLVERLMNAKSLQEQVEICEKARETAEFVTFRQCYAEITSELDLEVESVFSYWEIEFTVYNAVAIAVILIIESINDIDMFDDDGCEEFIDALRSVYGTQQEVAERIAYFLEGEKITSHTLEEMLEEFF